MVCNRLLRKKWQSVVTADWNSDLLTDTFKKQELSLPSESSKSLPCLSLYESFPTFSASVETFTRVCVAGAFLQHGVWPGPRWRSLWDACRLLSSLQSLFWYFLFLPDDGALPHRREVQSGLQGTHTQRVSRPPHPITSVSSVTNCCLWSIGLLM